jgi:hypothetical protein
MERKKNGPRKSYNHSRLRIHEHWAKSIKVRLFHLEERKKTKAKASEYKSHGGTHSVRTRPFPLPPPQKKRKIKKQKTFFFSFVSPAAEA